ncbi:MerR family transcriptional regulator [Anaerocolumna sp. MB42-C2]|uniref:MerR family transcriptional regulator n=1 Tax=Anaerocolumna sp. MB42-C2 TaxID=3070997 RepID=UPI0027E0E2DC|nr:MerR family transcriptional regulator [Anaerocolumna sp. MB42-C2]WMJ87419.1 MerR family transcriptional regulator [Anaerocolumna sp. MB42-C2]
MELLTISQVSKNFNISTRMLRYYENENIGLIESLRKDDYSYRVYDDVNIHKLSQIIILRKLRIPVKQINEILNSKDAVTAIEIFKHNIEELNGEISALSTIKSILLSLVETLQKNVNTQLKLNKINEEALLSMIDSLSLSKNYIVEEKSMDDFVKASKKLTELKDVRIIYLPPMTVASSQLIEVDMF